MQNKSLFYWVFYIISQFCCPKSAFSLVYIDIKTLIAKKNYVSAKKNLIKIIPLQRIGKPENIADTVLFLLSEQSCFITGTEIIVDGGLKARP